MARPPDEPDFSQPENCFCFASRRAARLLTGFYDSYLKPSGLKSTQYTLISLVDAAGTANVGTLAESLDADYTTIARNVAVLEKSGLLETVHSKDKRKHAVRLSPSGKKAFAVARPLWLEAQNAFLSHVGKRKAIEMLRDLR